VFFIGAGVTVYHGISSLSSGHAPSFGVWTLIVLAGSVLIEGTVLVVAVRATIRRKGDRSFVTFMRTTPDPTLVAVVLEDSAAVLGLLIAGASIALTRLTGDPVYDGVGSILVGLLLGLVAIFLANQNRKLLIDTSNPRTEDAVRRVLRAHPAVREVRDLRTVIFAPDEVLLVADLEYASDPVEVVGEDGAPLPTGTVRAVLGRVGSVTDDIEAAVRAAAPEVKDIYLEVEQFRARVKPRG
jgi:zinc transporter 9